MKNLKNFTYKDYASMSIGQILEVLSSSKTGLIKDQVEKSRDQHGSNTIDYGNDPSLLDQLVEAFVTPFTLVLVGLATISFVSEYVLQPQGEKELFTVIIITAMVLISGLVSFFQNYKSTKAVKSLQDMVKVTTNVTRSSVAKEVDMADVVVGDIINLAAGDMVPADMRLIYAKDLFVNQASLTGESEPVEKFENLCESSQDDLSDTNVDNLAYLGSSVVSGYGIGLVIKVGQDTIFGQIAEDLSTNISKTAFDEGVDSTSRLLVRFMMVMAPLVILATGLTQGDWFQAMLFGISVAVGLTPEMLPVIVNTNLVKGASTMSKKDTIVKNVSSIQNLGAIDVLCTDKTGTLTEDEIVLTYYLDTDGKSSTRVLRHAYLNSYYQTGLRNLMDKAIIAKAKDDLDLSTIKYEKIDEIPFDFSRRRLSVVVKDQNDKVQMVTKGAIEEILSICDYVDYNGEVKDLDQDEKNKVLEKTKDLNLQGFRVLGVAQKTNPRGLGEFGIEDESNMVLIGYLAFLDPPKASAKDAIRALKDHGVEVKIFTGDNEFVTKAVADQLGFKYESIVFGSDIEDLSDDKVYEILEKESIFVKLNPSQKSRLVRIMRDHGRVVGFLGDGINDGPALNASDVGISVDNGTDIAKESADIILMDKDLMILEEGILEGRKVFGNIMKYIKATSSSNFGNTFSLVLASIFLPFLPMKPVQLLFLNLIYDISCIAISWDHMDDDYLLEAKSWRADDIGNFMVWFGPVSTVFDVLSFICLYFVISPLVAGGSYQDLGLEGQLIFEEVFHAAWFVISIWTQTLVLYSLRTSKIPFIESRPSFIFAGVSLIGLVVGTIIPFTSVGMMLDLRPLPGEFWPLLVFVVIAYLVLTSLVKNAYVNKYKELI